MYFLVQCKWYHEERNQMEEELKIKNWMEMTEEEKTKRILKPENEREESVVVNFMTKSFKKRQTWYSCDQGAIARPSELSIPRAQGP